MNGSNLIFKRYLKFIKYLMSRVKYNKTDSTSNLIY